VRVRGVFLKILLWFWASLVLVAVALELAITATSTPVEVRVHRFSDNALSSRTREAVAVLDREGPPGVRRFLDDFERATGIHAVLLDAAGQAIAGRPIPAKATALAARALDSGQTEMEAEGQTALKARAVGVDGGRRYVLVASLPVGLMRLLRDAPSAQVLRLVAVLGTAAVACYGLARHVARPLATLQAATRELARGNLAVRVGPAMGRRRDEFAGLAQDFDRMAERLDALVTAERRLLRDISHELRSPLARLYVALGLARHEAGPERAGLDRIEREAERLNTLIGQLLTLARLESGTTGPAREAVELGSIAREVAADADFEARGRGRAVRVTDAGNTGVLGDAELLRSAIENVVRNAVRHTREGTTVEIALRREVVAGSPRVRITVRDHGPGVPEAALPYIFEPFYRVGEARERTTGGVGLGLTIAHRTIRLHGGTLAAANAPDGGLVVELGLPAPAADLRPNALTGSSQTA
jgi:two-component system, OmpR family, sensor histidine kinase CpxA